MFYYGTLFGKLSINQIPQDLQLKGIKEKLILMKVHYLQKADVANK